MLIVPGSINADLLFKVEHLPRPGETVLCPGYVMAPGGKGANQAAAAAKAGAEVVFVGHVGDDAYGPVVRGLLEEAGVDCAQLRVSSRPTAIAVIGVDAAGENAIIVASGANLDTAAAHIPDDLLRPGATVLCQNEIRSEESFAAVRRARERGARAILNLAPAGAAPDDALAALDVLIVNELEAAAVAGGDGEPVDLARARSPRATASPACSRSVPGCHRGGPRAGLPGRTAADPPGRHHRCRRRLRGRAGRLARRRGRPAPRPLRRRQRGGGLTCEGVGAQTAQPHAGHDRGAAARPAACYRTVRPRSTHPRRPGPRMTLDHPAAGGVPPRAWLRARSVTCSPTTSPVG